MEPNYGHGKICYVEIPAANVEQSAAFYRKVFGWEVRKRGDGSTAFDDGVGQVSGTWVTNRKPMAAGVMVHIMVDDAVATIEAIKAAGGEIVTPIGAHHPEITAQFRDPGGNVLGIYQHRG